MSESQIIAIIKHFLVSGARVAAEDVRVSVDTAWLDTVTVRCSFEIDAESLLALQSFDLQHTRDQVFRLEQRLSVAKDLLAEISK